MKLNAPMPESVSRCLWSYDTAQLDIKRDSVRIITNVLNYGTAEATDWLTSVYSSDQIKAVLAKPRPGEWDKKSLNYWALIFGVTPQIVSRFPDDHRFGRFIWFGV